jgi:hypothetical protein
MAWCLVKHRDNFLLPLPKHHVVKVEAYVLTSDIDREERSASSSGHFILRRSLRTYLKYKQ